MPSIKQQALNMIKRLPDDVNMDQIMYHLYVIEKINKGLQDIAEGRTVSHEEVKKRFCIK